MYSNYEDALRECARQIEITKGRMAPRAIALDREDDVYYILSPESASVYPDNDVTIIDS